MLITITETGAFKGHSNENVSFRLVEFLFEKAKLEGAVTLQTIVDLVQINPDFFKVFRQCFISELIAEAKKGPSKEAIEVYGRRNNPEDLDLEYLELEEVFELNSAEKIIDTPGFLSLSAKSYPLREDHAEYGRKGSRVSFSVSLTNIRDLLLLPIKVNQEVIVTEQDMASTNRFKTIGTYVKETFTLGRLFEGVFFELSFHGGPEDQEEVKEELNATLESCKIEESALNEEGLRGPTAFKSIDDMPMFYELGAKHFDALFEVSEKVGPFVKNKFIQELQRLEDGLLITKEVLTNCADTAYTAFMTNTTSIKDQTEIQYQFSVLLSEGLSVRSYILEQSKNVPLTARFLRHFMFT